ncbi:uncharacterized protein Cht6 [Eurosta solidaginis]|uniref:uncharacterized protein Cht6 n=1 Tax=Eurosta solidaginis TaxID=178769 RepID=UPI00353160CE
MLPLPRGAAWQTLFLLCAVLFINEIRSEGRVVCYYTNWSVYRPGTAKFNPLNINPYLCTHLVYAFGGFTKDNQMKPFDKYQDIEQGGYAKFTGLKTYNKQLKTMIAIGGWNEASSRFSPLMANPERRQKFIKNILKFLRQNHFDGIDLDWEYPAQREGGKQRDRENYAQFVQELRAEFERESEKTGRPRLLLTMAVPAGIENIEKGYDIPKLNKYLDWFNVLTYDFHSSHEPSANHHAPLYSLEEESEYNYDAELNIDYSIKYYLKAGADRDKLVLGIPTYGRSYTLINEDSTEIGAPSEGPGEQGDATREKGYLAYYEICHNLKEDPEWTVVQPNHNAMGPYAYRRNQWVGYDDEAIVRKKAQYVVEHGLGGIMFWAIDNDDFRGTCSGKPYPLIEAAKEAMLESLGVGINEVAKPNNQPKKPSRSRSRENSSSKLNRIGGGKEGKGSTRTTLSNGRRRPQSSTSTTTERVPETTIRLTNPEGSSLYIGGRTTTPPPPTTPDPGADFKCEEEGFFQHPRDCKKYYWCLDSGPSGLGIVGHQFTCPSGLYFNPAADSCDFARNVPCKIKKATISATGASTTTPRPTSAPNRITAATSRSSFFRTTTSTSTTTTTPEPIEYEDEEEEVDEDTPTHAKERDSEEDPQVIKELIDLIRKVGGIEELEKHLQRKEDGTIALKNGSGETGASTTQSPISKNLYEKVLSKPNTYNSFRNRFTSTSLYRKTGQAKVAEKAATKIESDDEESSEFTSARDSSKYSSVVRSNGRQGPQNEGLDKLADLDGLLKEKKQYVTINRNRGAFRHKAAEEDDDEADAEDKQTTVNEDEEEEDDEKGETSTKVKTTKRPTNTVTPSYVSIKRMRPSTVHSEIEEEAVNEEEIKATKGGEEKRAYTSLSRNRGRPTTESNQEAEDTVTNANRYKYLERTRPTSHLQSTLNARDGEKHTPADDDDDDNGEDEDNQEEEQNVTVQLNGAPIDSIQKSIQSTTTRNYANIGRRPTTTATTETPITNTQETPTRYNLLENTFNNETPEPPLTISTTEKTTTNDSPTLSISIKNTKPEIISTIDTPTTTIYASTSSTPASHPNISTTKAAAITTIANDLELTDSLYTITTVTPSFESDSRNTLDISFDVNSLIEHSALKANITIPSAITEKQVRTTAGVDDDNDVTTTTARTTSIATETNSNNNNNNTDTDVSLTNDEEEVTNLNKNLYRSKTQYNKYTTRTRNITKTTTTITDNTDTDSEHENIINDKNSKNSKNNNNKFATDTKGSSSTRSSADDKLSSNIRGNTVNKYSGGRRQQQFNELLPRKNQIQKNQQDSSSSSATNNQNKITTTDSTPTNEFLGTISSPRPFGFPRRRTRPNQNSSPTIATVNEDLKSTTTESTEDESRVAAAQASKPKVSSNSIGLKVENQNGLETNHEVKTASTQTQTKNLHAKMHVVVYKVDIEDKVYGVSGKNLSSLKHDVDRNLSLSVNNSFSAEESDSGAHTKNVHEKDELKSSKNERREDDKSNNDKRTAEAEETQSKHERTKDEDEMLTTAYDVISDGQEEMTNNTKERTSGDVKERVKALDAKTDNGALKNEVKSEDEDDDEKRATATEDNKTNRFVQHLNSLETNNKDERLTASKYRGKSLTVETEPEETERKVQDKYRTRGLKMVNDDSDEMKIAEKKENNVTESSSTDGTTKSNEANELTEVSEDTNGMTKVNKTANTETNEGGDIEQNEKEADENTTTAAEAKEHEQNELKTDENRENLEGNDSNQSTGEISHENSSIDETTSKKKTLNENGQMRILLKEQEEFKETDSTVLNTMEIKSESTEALITPNTSTENMKELPNSKTRTEDNAETVKRSNAEHNYQEIVRNREAPITEIIHYKTIVRNGKGVELSEYQSSPFHRKLEEVAKQADLSRERVYQSISRAGKLPQTNEEAQTTTQPIEESKDSPDSMEEIVTNGVSENESVTEATTLQREISRFTDKTNNAGSEVYLGEYLLASTQTNSTILAPVVAEGSASNANEATKDNEVPSTTDSYSTFYEMSDDLSIEKDANDRHNPITAATPITTDSLNIAAVRLTTKEDNNPSNDLTTSTASESADIPAAIVSPENNTTSKYTESTDQPPVTLVGTTSKFDTPSEALEEGSQSRFATTFAADTIIRPVKYENTAETEVLDASVTSSTEQTALKTNMSAIENSETTISSSSKSSTTVRRRPIVASEPVTRGRPGSLESTQSTLHESEIDSKIRVSNRHRSGKMPDATDKTFPENTTTMGLRDTTTETSTRGLLSGTSTPITTVPLESIDITTTAQPEFEMSPARKITIEWAKESPINGPTTTASVEIDLPELNHESPDDVAANTEPSTMSDKPDATAAPVTVSTANPQPKTEQLIVSTEDETTSATNFADTAGSFGYLYAGNDLQPITQSKEPTTETSTSRSVSTMTPDIRNRAETTYEYVLKSKANTTNSEKVSSKETSLHEISAAETGIHSRHPGHNREEANTNKHYDATTETPTPRRRTVYRGTYRPGKDEGDLSSLLATDINKQRPENHTEHNHSHRISFNGTQKAAGNDEFLLGRQMSDVESSSLRNSSSTLKTDANVNIGKGDEKANEEGTNTSDGKDERIHEESVKQRNTGREVTNQGGPSENASEKINEAIFNKSVNEAGDTAEESSQQSKHAEEESNVSTLNTSENVEGSENKKDSTNQNNEARNADNKMDKINSTVLSLYVPSFSQRTNYVGAVTKASASSDMSRESSIGKNSFESGSKTVDDNVGAPNNERKRVVFKENADETGNDQSKEQKNKDFRIDGTPTTRKTFSALSRYSGRVQRPSSAQTLNRDGIVTKNGIDQKGFTKTQTTYTQTYNADNNVQKLVKRVHTKRVDKTEPEYEYVYETITEKVHTTPRSVTRNRGSVRFRDSDLSSLLSLDFAPKTKRREGDENPIVKQRRKVIRKLAKVSENETVEEYEEEEERKIATRPPRPSTTAATTIEAPLTSRRTRTRPLRKIAKTTTASSVKHEGYGESILKFSSKKPFEKYTPVTTAAEPDALTQTTRRGFQFKRQPLTTTTASEPISTTTEAPRVSTYRPLLRRRVLKTQKPLNDIESVHSKTKEKAEAKEIQDISCGKQLSSSGRRNTIATTEVELETTTAGTTEVLSTTSNATTTDIALTGAPTTESKPTTTSTTSTEAKTTTITTTKSELSTTSTSANESEPTKTMSTTEIETDSAVATINSTLESERMQKLGTKTADTTTQAFANADNSLDYLRKQFSHALRQLKENAEQYEDSKEDATGSPQNKSTNETEKSAAEAEVKSVNELTPQRVASHLQNELNTSDDDSSISIPIYHRRKYFQYYKDSPIIYIGKPQLPKPQAQTSSTDIKKQIHDVFNISNEDSKPVASDEAPNDNSVNLEESTTINNEKNHFLLGAKSIGTKFTVFTEEKDDDKNAKEELEKIFAITTKKPTHERDTANNEVDEDDENKTTTHRVGKTFRETVSKITKFSAIETDLDSAQSNPTAEVILQHETPTIKLPIYMEDSNERSEDGRALRSYGKLSRLRTTIAPPAEESTELTEENTTKRAYSTVYRIKSATEVPASSVETTGENAAEEESQNATETARSSFNRFTKLRSRVRTTPAEENQINEETETNTKHVLNTESSTPTEAQEQTTRRTFFNGLNRLRFRSTTPQPLKEEDQSENERIVDSNDSTTQRTLISRNRFRITTKTAVESEEEGAEATTASSIRRRQNTPNRYRTTTAKSIEEKVENEQADAVTTTDNPSRRRPTILNRFRTTTTRTAEDKGENESGFSQNSKDSTTRRTFITRNRFRTTTARTTTEVNESTKERAEASTTASSLRRASIIRNRTTTSSAIEENVENVNELGEEKEEEDTNEGENATTRRQYAVFNRPPTRSTKNNTEKKNESSQSTAKLDDITPKVSEEDTTTHHIYNVIRRKRPQITSESLLKESNATKEIDSVENLSFSKADSEGKIGNNAIEEDIINREETHTDSPQTFKSDEAENAEDGTNNLNETEEVDENITEAAVVTDGGEDNESSTEFKENLEGTTDTDEGIHTTTESEGVTEVTRTPIVIRKRIRITTTEAASSEETKDEAVDETTTESNSRRTLVIRNRLRPTTSAAAEETTRTPVVIRRRLTSKRVPVAVSTTKNENTEDSTTRRAYASLNRRRLSTSTTQLPGNLLIDNKDDGVTTTQIPNFASKVVFGQTNRHRALPVRTTQAPKLEEDEDINNESVEREEPRSRNFKSLNPMRATTAAQELPATESFDTTTRRAFNLVRSTTAAVPVRNEEDLTTGRTTFTAFNQRKRPTTTSSRPLPSIININVYERNEGPDDEENEVVDGDEDRDDYDDSDVYNDELLASVKSTYQNPRTQFSVRPQFRAFRRNTQRKTDEENVDDYDEYENTEDNYEDNPIEPNESVTTNRPSNEIQNSLQKLRDRVKASQTKNENDEGVINSKLQLLLANKAKTTVRAYTKKSLRDATNADEQIKPEVGDSSEAKDSSENRDLGQKRRSFTPRPNVKSTLTGLLANRGNTNRTSTVGTNLKRTNFNLSLKTNTNTQLRAKDSRYSSLTANEAEREADKQIAKFDNVNDVNNDDDDNNDVDHNTNSKGNEVNSKRRFQKYQYNRSRFTTTTTSTTTESPQTGAARNSSSLFTPRTKLYQLKRNRTTAATTTTENQVNALVNDKNDVGDDEVEEDDDYDDNSDEEDESSTTTTTESTPNSIPAPTLRRIRVLKYRRPIGAGDGLDNDTNTISNDSNLNDSNVSNTDSSNSANSSSTNTTNTVRSDLHTVEPQVERARIEHTNSENSEVNETETEGPVINDSSPTPKRIRKVIRKLVRPVNRKSEATLTENDNSSDAISVTTSDNKLSTTRTTLFGNGTVGARFGNSVTSTNETETSKKGEEVAEEEHEEESEAENEDEEDSDVSEEVTAQAPVSTKALPLPTRQPFVLTRSTSTTKVFVVAENTDGNDENEEYAVSANEEESTDANDAEEDEEADEYEEEDDEEEQTEQEETTTELPIINIVDDENVQRNRLSKLTFTRTNITSSADTNTTEESAQTDELKLNVTSTRLKKLLPYENTSTVITSNELPGSGDNDKSNATQPKFIPIRRPFGLGGPVHIATPQKIESVNVSEEDNVAVVTTTTSRTPLTRPTFRRKLVAKRPYVPGKPFSIATSTTPTPFSTTTKRKFVRRKFGSFQPFSLGNRNTGAGFVPRSQLLPESKRFRFENGKRVPVTDGDNGNADDANEEYNDGNEGKEEEDEEVEDTSTTARTQTAQAFVTLRPVTPPTQLFTRPPIPVLHAVTENKETVTEDNEKAAVEDEEATEEDEEEDEEEEYEEEEAEDSGAVEDNAKLTPTKIQPKDNRAPPGFRPALNTSSTPHAGNVPFNTRVRLPLSGPGRLNVGNRYGTSTPGNTRATNKPRVINRPQGVPPPNLALKPLKPTKPALFIPINTRLYERKYTATSTETPEPNNNDNSLIEDINIEALNARNKKIFDINSKKHTTLKPMITNSGGKQTPTDQEQQEQEPEQQQPDTQDHLRQNTITENDDHPTVVSVEQGFITTTPRTANTFNTSGDTNTDLYHANNANKISSQDNETDVERDGYTTPQIPTTTLVHVFTLTDEEQTSPAPIDEEVNFIGRLVPERTEPEHKVVEVNRIVEITSKEEKVRRKSKANQEFIQPISSSPIMVVSLPSLERLGEISVVKYVHLVDGSDISVDSHSSVTDYTPTDLTGAAPVRNSLPDQNLGPVQNYVPVQNSVPVRNSLPEEGPYYVPQYAYSTESAQIRTTLEQRNGKALIPDVIRSAVETSTISLEGLFDEARQGRVFDSINNVYYVFATTPKNVFDEDENINQNVNETIDDNVNAESQNRNINMITTLPTINTTTTTERPYPVFTPQSNDVNNIPYVANTNLLESTATDVSNNFESESTTNMPEHTSSNAVEAIYSQNYNIDDAKSNTLETTTTTPTTPTTTDGNAVVLKSSTYVRPVVPLPLLRPESNESSPLVITIANLDKVILSKVDRTNSAENTQTNNTETHTHIQTEESNADTYAEYSNNFASVVEAPNNLIHEPDANTHNTAEGYVSMQTSYSVGNISSSSKNSSSIANEASYALYSNGVEVNKLPSNNNETHVQRKNKSRKHRARNGKAGRKHKVTVAPENATVTFTPEEVKNSDEGYESQSSSMSAADESVTEMPTGSIIATSIPRVRIVNLTKNELRSIRRVQLPEFVALIRTPTATTIITANTQTRRPLLSVRRRKINTPNASSGIAYQTAITSASTTAITTQGQTATTITTANTYYSTNSDELQIITTELPTTFNKQQHQHQQQLNRNRTKLIAPAVTATALTTITNTDPTAPSTTTSLSPSSSLLLSQQSSSSSSSPTAAAIILNTETSNSGSTNFKSYLNTKYRAKLLATTLSTGASPTIITTTPTIEAADATTTTTSNINDIIQTANANTKQPSTLLRRKFQTRRLITTTTLSPTEVSGTDQPRTQNPLFRRRSSHPTNPSATALTTTPADSLTKILFVDGFELEDPADQVAKSSIHTNHFNELLEQAEAIKEPVARQELTSDIKVSPLKSSFRTKTKSAPAALYTPNEPNHKFVESITRRMGTVAVTTEHTTPTRKSTGSRGRPQKYTPTTPQIPVEPVISRRAQTVSRRRPNKYADSDNYDRLNSYQPVPVKKPNPVGHRSSHKQIVDYDYYDDDSERVVGNTKGQQLKVILHGRGIIECLDQGNFPHPLSCRKFISCAKFETGGVVGWEYTCPKGLSYDPVGGMCNWAAGLGCKE